VRDALNSSNF